MQRDKEAVAEMMRKKQAAGKSPFYLATLYTLAMWSVLPSLFAY